MNENNSKQKRWLGVLSCLCPCVIVSPSPLKQWSICLTDQPSQNERLTNENETERLKNENERLKNENENEAYERERERERERGLICAPAQLFLFTVVLRT